MSLDAEEVPSQFKYSLSLLVFLNLHRSHCTFAFKGFIYVLKPSFSLVGLSKCTVPLLLFNFSRCKHSQLKASLPTPWDILTFSTLLKGLRGKHFIVACSEIEIKRNML